MKPFKAKAEFRMSSDVLTWLYQQAWDDEREVDSFLDRLLREQMEKQANTANIQAQCWSKFKKGEI